MPAETETLDRLITRLDALLADGQDRSTDAIDEILAAPGRSSQVRSLRDSEVMQQFRNDLIDGLIRVDTANQLLRLITVVLSRIPLP